MISLSYTNLIWRAIKFSLHAPSKRNQLAFSTISLMKPISPTTFTWSFLELINDLIRLVTPTHLFLTSFVNVFGFSPLLWSPTALNFESHVSLITLNFTVVPFIVTVIKLDVVTAMWRDISLPRILSSRRYFVTSWRTFFRLTNGRQKNELSLRTKFFRAGCGLHAVVRWNYRFAQGDIDCFCNDCVKRVRFTLNSATVHWTLMQSIVNVENWRFWP